MRSNKQKESVVVMGAGFVQWEDDGMEFETLRVQMLGKFAMYYKKIPISLNKTSSAKSVRLLQTILLSGAEGIAKSELIDSLYGWSEQSDAGNRNKNLNNLMYRLRGQLAASGLPEAEYIVMRDGYLLLEQQNSRGAGCRDFPQHHPPGGEERGSGAASPVSESECVLSRRAASHESVGYVVL